MTADRIRIGFLPLVDAALPILAREQGFAEAEGLEIELVRDMSWATRTCSRRWPSPPRWGAAGRPRT